MPTTRELLGARIREVRKLRGLTQERLSEKVGVEPKQVSRIESGKSSPSTETLESIARELQVEMKALFDFQHLQDDDIEVQVVRLLKMMDIRTRRLAYRLMQTLVE